MTNQKASAVLHRQVNKKPVTATQGYGAFLRAKNGDPLLDLSSGAGVTCLGYSNKNVINAIKDQLDALPYVHSANFTTDPVEQLAQMLLDSTEHPSFKDGAVMFLNGGGEAVEAACKLAVQYFQETGWPDPVFIGRQHSYHGNSFFCLALGDHPRKQPYQNYNPLADHYKFLAPHNSTIDDWLYDTPVAIVIEPIAGTTHGITPPDAHYLKNLQMGCQKNGQTLLIYDEVLCGNFRTGHPFAWQYYAPNNPPDMIVIGKGLTAGYFPLSAVIVNARVRAALEQGSGKLWHSTTNQNHALGCAAGIVAWAYYTNHKDLICGLAAQLQAELQQLPIGFGGVDKISGVGTLWGIQLDPTSKGLHLRIREQALQHGLTIYTDGGTVNGQGNMILLAPPYCITKDDLHNGLQKLFEIIRQNHLEPA